MKDSAQAIAADMIAQVGRAGALAYLFGKLLGVSSWRRGARAGQLMVAVALSPHR